MNECAAVNSKSVMGKKIIINSIKISRKIALKVSFDNYFSV